VKHPGEGNPPPDGAACQVSHASPTEGAPARDPEQWLDTFGRFAYHGPITMVLLASLLILAVVVGFLSMGKNRRPTWMYILYWVSRIRADFAWFAIVLFVTLLAKDLAVDPIHRDQTSSDFCRAEFFFDNLYHTLMMIPLSADADLAQAGPFTTVFYNLFRLLLPLLAVAAVAIVAMGEARNRLQLLLMPKRGHNVICGLGEIGFELARQWSPSESDDEEDSRPWKPGILRWLQKTHRGAKHFMKQEPLVVIESDKNNGHIAECRAMGIPVITDDGLARDFRALKKARVQDANRVFSMLPDDPGDIEFALRIQDYLSEEGTPRDTDTPSPRVIVQIDSPGMSRRLSDYSRIANLSSIDLRFHSLSQTMATDLLLRYPPDLFASLADAPRPHIVVYGFGTLGQRVVTEAIRLCQFRTPAFPKFTIYDQDEEEVRRFLEAELPGLYSTAIAEEHAPHGADHTGIGEQFPAEFVVKKCRFGVSAVTPDDLSLGQWLGEPGVPAEPPTQHVVCFERQAFALTFALALRTTLLTRNLFHPIFVRAKWSRGLASLLDSNTGSPEIPDGLFPFGTIDDLCRLETFDNPLVEHIATKFHQQYRKSDAPNIKSDQANREWRRLRDYLRRDNRYAALHTDTKLRAIGMRRVLRDVDPDHVRAFEDPAVVDTLARMEHRRWCASKLADGWRSEYAPGRVDILKQHPGIRPYDPIQDDKNNHPLVQALPSMIAMETAEPDCPDVRLRYHAVPEFRIGVLQLSDFDASIPPAPRPGFSENTLQDMLKQVLSRIRSVDGPELGEAKRIDLLQQRAFTIYTPGIFPAERELVELLFPMLQSTERPHSMKEYPVPESLHNPPEHSVFALLPMPYDYLTDTLAYLKAGREEQREQVQKEFRGFMGYRCVRYAELPLEHSPTQHLDKIDHDVLRRQMRRTWRFISLRCDVVFVLRDISDMPEAARASGGLASLDDYVIEGCDAFPQIENERYAPKPAQPPACFTVWTDSESTPAT